MERITVEIDALLERAQAELEGQRYWYPLSWPTYGTPEIVEALESMCAFRTTMRVRIPAIVNAEIAAS